jgi:hypothetical protein
MRRLRRTVFLALAASLLVASPAAAEDYCVGEEPGCLPTLAAALDAAREHLGPDRVLLAAGEHEVPPGAADAPGEPVEIVGDGPNTRLTPAVAATSTLWLADPASRAIGLTVDPPGPTATETLRLAGVTSRVVVSAAVTGDIPTVRMLAHSRMSDTLVSGPVVVAATPARIERSVLTIDRAAAVSVESGEGTVVVEQAEIVASEGAAAVFDLACATVSARHLTITGAAPRVVDAACPGLEEKAAFELRSSIVHGEFPDFAEAEANAVSSHSAHDDDPDVQATARLEFAEPGFTSTSDLRPQPGSPLIDAGEPGPLLAGEGFWDLGSRARVVDGDGDGTLRRDVGAHERQPVAPVAPAGNVLVNAGAESGVSILTTGEGPAPPAWTRTGAFSQVRYGAVARTAQGADITLPTREAGVALGGGGAFFSAGPGEGGRLLQRIDVTESAAEIDTGLASASLSGLLGGYGADDDEVRVTATFRDPAGNPLSALDLGAVTAVDRGNATNLLHRSAAGAIPQRTRAVDVEITGTRVSAPGSAETYADAYADNLALVLSVPGIAVPGPVDPAMPPVKNLRPFAGVTVLTGRPKLSSRGRAKVRLACASATVGRCSGTLELRAQLRRGLAFSRIAQFARFDLGAGRSTTVTVKLTLAARRALRRARSFRATLRAVARDGQGLERKTTIPIRVVRSAPVRRR